MITSGCCDLGTDAVVCFVGLNVRGRREHVYVLKHFLTRHPHACVDARELVELTVRQFPLIPVNVPDDLASAIGRFRDGLYRILGKLTKKLQRGTILAHAVQHEARVVDRHRERAGCVVGDAGVVVHDYLLQSGRDRFSDLSSLVPLVPSIFGGKRPTPSTEPLETKGQVVWLSIAD
jgi:hypothetical protein